MENLGTKYVSNVYDISQDKELIGKILNDILDEYTVMNSSSWLDEIIITPIVQSDHIIHNSIHIVVKVCWIDDEESKNLSTSTMCKIDKKLADINTRYNISIDNIIQRDCTETPPLIEKINLLFPITKE